MAAIHGRPLVGDPVRSIVLSISSAAFLLAASSTQSADTILVGTVTVPLPAGAIVVPHPHGHGHFNGVRVQLEERTIVEVAALPPTALPLRVYLDSMVRSRNARARTAWRLAPPEPRLVAGRTAWVLHPTCGDCQAVEVYLDFPGTRLVADWGVDRIGDLTPDQRHALAWAFVDSFRSATRAAARVPAREPPEQR